ncbi:MAG: leukotriene A4 hydrolase C-terminal domain-containing protein, partial [Thermoanaerobaculales bacterium]|nr:leukotriene A4 hydrolase C-terminal domain-containing protein [Thermoanaerobaculales bacterium]
FGAYEWDRYDMIVMPFSFPYGGMENPRLTFLTPTLLAGDRSLVNVVAHELAHSWTGNLVTNATMEDFWINEGFTVWAERRILEALEGPEFAALHAANGRIELEAAMENFGPDSPYTQLKTPLEGVDPDEVYSLVPYEKGFLFVTLLEQTLGRKQWDVVVGRYIERFRFTSITTDELLRFIDEEAPGLLDRVGVQEWVFQKGLPANAPVFTSDALERLRSLAEGWDGGVRPDRDQVDAWSSEEWLLYLKALPKVMSVKGCEELDGTFGLSTSGNYEILVAWLTLAVRSAYDEVLPRVREILTTVGRAKFLRPLYTELLEREELHAFAQEIFDEMKDRYHTLSRVAIAGIFEKASKTG